MVARALWFIAVSSMAFFPVVLFFFTGSDFSGLASESIAYRFFYSMRLYAGPDPTAWLPQGQLITTIQHAINYFLLPTMDGSLANLRATLNDFAYCTLVVVGCVIVTMFYLAARSRSLLWRDRVALTIIVFAPLYSGAGGSLFLADNLQIPKPLLPDYYFLNIALMAAATLLFQLQWRNEGTGDPRLRALAAGVFVGLLAANKISMAVLGGPLVAAILFSQPFRPLRALQCVALSALGAVTTFATTFLAAGLFRVGWLRSVWRPWLAFITNPGGDEGFSSQALGYMASGYGVMIAWWLVAFALAVVSSRSEWSTRKGVVLAAIVAGSLACGFFIWKRPAVTTFGESCSQLLAFGVMCITMVRRRGVGTAATATLAVFLCGAAIAERPDKWIFYWATTSRAVADEQWGFFARAVSAPAPSGIRYFIPDNNYQFCDVFVILLKGASDFLTWNISANGQWIIDRYAPGLKFVTDLNPNKVSLDHARLVWFDAPWLTKIPAHCPELAAAINKPGVTVHDVPLPASRVIGHLAQMP
jgi:hypothetical protein